MKSQNFSCKSALFGSLLFTFLQTSAINLYLYVRWAMVLHGLMGKGGYSSNTIWQQKQFYMEISFAISCRRKMFMGNCVWNMSTIWGCSLQRCRCIHHNLSQPMLKQIKNGRSTGLKWCPGFWGPWETTTGIAIKGFPTVTGMWNYL